MANILAGRSIVKEFIQQDATPAALAAEGLRLLDDPAARARLREDLATIRSQLLAPGTISPAQAVLDIMG
jgi:lipid-A-disaccharide synthase